MSSTGPEVAAWPVLPLRASALPRAASAVTVVPPFRVRPFAGRTLSAEASSFHQSNRPVDVTDAHRDGELRQAWRAFVAQLPMCGCSVLLSSGRLASL
ncbi:hypothetical protein [Streptomyces sp. 900105755]